MHGERGPDAERQRNGENASLTAYTPMEAGTRYVYSEGFFPPAGMIGTVK
jgi:hypothetical protein